MSKIGLITLGCAKNQTDSEVMLSLIKQKGYEIVSNEEEADVVIINTCAFIESAKEEALEVIFEAVNLKKQGILKGIIVCGCLPQRYDTEIKTELYEVDAFLGTGSYQKIIEALEAVLNNRPYVDFSDINISMNEGERVLLNDSFYAYLKVSEGCDNCCSYCVIPLVRGRFRSRKFEDIIKEAKELAKNGVKEINVIAQDTTRYGMDIYGEEKLCELLEEISKIEGIEWIRLLYCYPSRISDKLLDLINENDKIVKYIDIPLQHASKHILIEQNRKACVENIDNIVDRIREKVKNVTIRTTFICGLPNESEEDFELLCNYVKKNRFDRLGVFCYSREEGTKAYDMENQVDADVAMQRQQVLMDIQYQIVCENNSLQIGKIKTVLTEGYDNIIKMYYGRSQSDAPEVDPKVFFTSKKKIKPGEFVDVKITKAHEYDLYGEIVDD